MYFNIIEGILVGIKIKILIDCNGKFFDFFLFKKVLFKGEVDMEEVI